jgi:hypothetical protein
MTLLSLQLALQVAARVNAFSRRAAPVQARVAADPVEVLR